MNRLFQGVEEVQDDYDEIDLPNDGDGLTLVNLTRLKTNRNKVIGAKNEIYSGETFIFAHTMIINNE